PERLGVAQRRPHKDEGLTRPEPRPSQARLPFRGADHLLRVHAVGRNGQRPYRGLLQVDRGAPAREAEPEALATASVKTSALVKRGRGPRDFPQASPSGWYTPRPRGPLRAVFPAGTDANNGRGLWEGH